MLPLEDLELQVEKELEGLTILPEFRDWALEVLNENNDREIEDRTKVYEMQHKNLVTTQKELDNLTKCATEILLTIILLSRRGTSCKLKSPR